MQATGLLNAGYQGVSDHRLIDARLRHGRIGAWLRDIKAHGQPQPEEMSDEMLHDEVRTASPSAPSRERKGAAVRSNRFVRAASPGTSRTAAEIARRRREATLLGELYKIGPSCTSAAPACPAWPGDQPRSGAPEISQDTAPAASPADSRIARRRSRVRRQAFLLGELYNIGPSSASRAGPSVTPTFTWPLARESSSSISLHSRASAAIARLRRQATDSATLLRERYKARSLIAQGASVKEAEGRTKEAEGRTALTVATDNGQPEMAAVMLGEYMQKSHEADESFKTQVLAVLP